MELILLCLYKEAHYWETQTRPDVCKNRPFLHIFSFVLILQCSWCLVLLPTALKPSSWCTVLSSLFFFCNATCHTMIGWETWKAEVAWVYSCWCWRAKCLNWPYYLQYLYVLLKICVHSLTFMLRHLIIQHLTIWCIFLSIGLPSLNLPRYYNYDVHDTTIFSHHLSYDGGKLCA